MSDEPLIVMFSLSNRMPEVSDCGKYLMLFIMKGCKDMLLYFSKLESSDNITGKMDFVKVVTEFDSDYDVSFSGFILKFKVPVHRLC